MKGYTFKQSRMSVSGEDLQDYMSRRERLLDRMPDKTTDMASKIKASISAFEAYKQGAASDEQEQAVREMALYVLKRQDRAPLGLILAEKMK